jgi:hypothetical protein
MATHKQEDIYNKIMKYYNFIDQLIDLSHEDPELKRDAEFKIVQSIIKTLEHCADDMSKEFINYIKQPRSEQIKTNTLVAIDKVIARVHEAKERMLHIKSRQS